MTNDNPQKLIDELDELLDRERQALFQGDLAQLGRMVSQKDALIGKINSLDTIGRNSLADVHQKAARNQVLLDSALEGIRAVISRMTDLRHVRRGLETYDRTGRKKNVGTQSRNSVEKRA
jgi:hypothetical protein